ncbi:SusD family protein [compost metagenome]
MATIAASCKKLIEVPGNPPNKITQAQQFTDSATTMTAVAGVYSYPSNGGGSFTFNDGYLSWSTGLSSDELSTTSTDVANKAFFNYSLTSRNPRVTSLWTKPYTGLFPVNAILEQVPLSSGLSATFKKQIVAEMKVLRAFYYFNMINLFGGVPLVLSTEYKVTSVLPRSSVDQVYIQILKDLTEAQRDLPANYPSTGRYRPNLYTVNAFLAKVRLYRKEWQAAADAATTVINNTNTYKLETDLDKVFLDGSGEAIWQLPAVNPSSSTSVQDASNFVPQNNQIFPTYPLSTYLLDAFEAGDLRRQKWVGTALVPGSPAAYYPYKYKNNSANRPTVEDFMIFRLAEQYLIRAEARIHLGDISGGIDDLNFLRARSRPAASGSNPDPLPDLDKTMSEANALKALMKERQTELFTEWGNRWFDLKRTGTADEVLAAEKSGWQPNAALYPIPQSERGKNPFLSQNIGYQ